MPEAVILKFMKDLPVGGMLQTCPVSLEGAIAWAELHKAEKVYYYEKTKNAFIVYKRGEA